MSDEAALSTSLAQAESFRLHLDDRDAFGFTIRISTPGSSGRRMLQAARYEMAWLRVPVV